MEYSTRTLTPTPSGSSLPMAQGAVVGPARLSPSPSADSFMKAAAARKLHNPQLLPSPEAIPKTLGQSGSASSLLSVESDSSAPPPVAPPRSAQLNTGEVLQPYSASHCSSGAVGMTGMTASQAQTIQQSRQQQHAGPSQPRRVPYHSPAMGQSVMPVHSPTMAVVNSQSVVTREPSAPAPPPAAYARNYCVDSAEPPPPAAVDGQSTWVIEEVIDFGVPLDEGMVRECDDNGYPLGCKSLSIGEVQRGNVSLFEGCVHNVCYDEQEMHDQRDDRGFC